MGYTGQQAFKEIGLFIMLGLLASLLLLTQLPDIRYATLLAIAVWAFCRAYYFAFYVIEVLKKPRKAKTASTETADTGEKRLSCVAAALKVLGESSDPMNAQELISAMESKGYWASPGGKTPHATLYSAIFRDLAKGDNSKFVKTERGRFTVRS